MQPRTPRTIEQALLERKSSGLLRELYDIEGRIDLCSNDYLGLSRTLAQESTPEIERLGATGSRLVSGNSWAHEEFEGYLAETHQCEAALVLGSGYEANLGLLSCIADRGDTIVFDELCHASMRDGIRLSFARSYSFRHNDLDDLRKKLQSARGECFIAVESVYSMDGDIAPLKELCDIADECGAYLIVDEAHATGIFGAQGEGLTQSLGLSERVFARVHTFGKALGYKGACVVGQNTLRRYLINFARPFIYSTAPDAFSLGLMRRAYECMQAAKTERQQLWSLVDQFRSLRSEFSALEFLDASSPIQGVVVPGNSEVVEVERALLNAGYAVRAIRSPTVPAGRERIRICLHAFNSISEIQAALGVVSECLTGRSANAV